MSQKRQDYITWDEYFMGVAMLSAMRSKDPGTQVGACIVSQDNKILSMGYNGFPLGCSDDEFPWNGGSRWTMATWPVAKVVTKAFRFPFISGFMLQG